MSILDTIYSPSDIKRLNYEQTERLCSEIREFLINSVAKTGGHLSSNLGIVELSVALHRVYDTSVDRIVFDVGHQSYVHKILTGRRQAFANLREIGGISGFPKPSESVHDAFIAGHASNSISVALGMARARSIKGEDYQVVAIIGDGALTGGLAYEGLSNAGESGQAMVVVLNDNGMSINQNVGGIASLLAGRRVKPGYLSFKRAYRRIVGKLPAVYDFFHRIKEFIKGLFLYPTMFEDMGFYYLGPVSGYDIKALEAAIEWAKELKCPVLLHVITEKGRGCSYARENPEIYHGVGRFDPKTGELSQSVPDFSQAFGKELTKLAACDESLFAITAAMAEGTGLDHFSKCYPERFFDVGIAEGHAVSMAAGMAKQGVRPVFAVYSSFLQRSVDMLIHDACLLELHIILAVDRAGLVGRDGETHHGSFDVALLCAAPGMTVFCPSSFAELRVMLKKAIYDTGGPVALRYPRGGEGAYKDNSADKQIEVFGSGDAAIVTYGILINEALAAAEILAGAGIMTRIIKLNQICPIDKDGFLNAIEGTRTLVVVEDCCRGGCIGETLLALMAFKNTAPKSVRLLNLGNGVVTHGETRELWRMLGIDARGIAEAVGELSEVNSY